MGDLIDIAAGVMASSNKRLEYVSQNVANTGTAGYKKQVAFSNLVTEMAVSGSDSTLPSLFTDFSQGKFTETKNPLDLAISGRGFFKLRAEDNTYFTRQGLFHMQSDGRVLSPQGYALQQMDGGDVVLRSANVEILDDGTVLDQGLPVAQIGLFQSGSVQDLHSVSGTLFAANEGDFTEDKTSKIRQGMVEAANVTLSDEMVEMMAAIRQAEMGSRLVQVYDTLMGQAITTFGQGAR